MSTCPVCLDHFSFVKLPRILPCGHTICQSCVVACLSQGQFFCPLDRKQHPINLGRGAFQFPKNHALIDELSLLPLGDDPPYALCGRCKVCGVCRVCMVCGGWSKCYSSSSFLPTCLTLTLPPFLHPPLPSCSCPDRQSSHSLLLHMRDELLSRVRQCSPCDRHRCAAQTIFGTHRQALRTLSSPSNTAYDHVLPILQGMYI